MAYPILRKTLIRLISRRIVSLSGLQHLPGKGPAILVANHVGLHDPLLLICAVVSATGGRKVHSIAKWKIFRRNFFQNWGGTIPLYENRAQTMEIAQRILSSGGILLIYPEGGVNTSSIIGKVSTGAARLALQIKVPVIPVGLRRTSPAPKKEFGHYLDLLFSRVSIFFGQPIDLSPWYNQPIDRRLLAETMRAIMELVADLAGKKYSGFN